jgi:hypothetical protein
MLTILMVSSCKSRKKTTVDAPPTTIDSSVKAIQTHSQWLFQEAESWKNFSAKLHFNAEFNGSKMSFNGQAKMIKDSCIWMSVTYLGLEAARIFVTKTHIIGLDKFNKRAMKIALDRSKEVIPLDFKLHQLQHILLGYCIFPVEGSHKMTIHDRIFRFSESYDSLDLIQEFELEKLIPALVSLSNTKNQDQLTITYQGDIQMIDQHRIPDKLLFEFVTSLMDSKKPNRLLIQIQKPAFPEEVNTSFSIPPSYDIEEF